MAKQMMLPYPYGANINDFAGILSQNLRGQAYDTNVMVLSPEAVNITVTKNREGFKNVIGMGLECRVNMNVFGGNQLSVNIESEWTNKIIAIAIGWFFCMIPLITGIIGAVDQNSMPEAILNAIQSTVVAMGNGNGQPKMNYQPNYQQVYQQGMYNQGMNNEQYNNSYQPNNQYYNNNNNR